MAKQPYKATVTVIGPHRDDMDREFRRLAVEVEIQHEERPLWESGLTRYRIQAWSNYSREQGRWFEPVMPGIEVPVYGRGIDLQHAEKVVKDLKALFRYMDKLPVRPRNLEELVATIGTMHTVKAVHLATAPDSHTRMDWEETNIQRAARVAQKVYDGLVPEE